ncbi:hypothetical protein E4U55_000389 [Claviceps digitariae]|nr:hypothetical protein E4U55_000389 [Claviceps digitariae]
MSIPNCHPPEDSSAAQSQSDSPQALEIGPVFIQAEKATGFVLFIFIRSGTPAGKPTSMRTRQPYVLFRNSGVSFKEWSSMAPSGGSGHVHEIKGEKNGVIIIGIHQDKLVLPLGPEKRFERVKRHVGQLGRAADTTPGYDGQDVPGRGDGVLEGWVNVVEAQACVVQQTSLSVLAGVVVKRLLDDAVDVDVLGGDLLVDSPVVVLGQVDGVFEKVHLAALIAAVPAGHDAAFFYGSIVDLIQCAAFDDGLGLEGEGLVHDEDLSESREMVT